MRKLTLLVACGAVAILATGVQAQTNSGLAFVLDVRATAADMQNPDAGDPFNSCFIVGGLNGGAEGDGAVLYLQPKLVGSAHIIVGPNGPEDTSAGELHLYMQVEDRENPGGTPPAPGDVISSVGLDFELSALIAGTTPLDGFSYAWDDDGDPALLWTGSADGAPSATGWDDARAVTVAVNATPMYDSTGRHVPAAVPYHIGVISASCDCRGAANQDGQPSSRGLKMVVDTLLITRTYGDAGGIAAGPSPELHDFGYVGGLPEAGAGTGIQDGTSSATDDAKIVCRLKGDFVIDGIVASGDIGAIGGIGFLGAFGGGITCEQQFLGDFDLDGIVASGDIGQIDGVGFLGAFGMPDGCP